jgi:hypothetical protein
MAKVIVKFLETGKAEGVCYYRGSVVEMNESLAKSLDIVVPHKLEVRQEAIKHQKPKGKKDGRTKDQD